MNRKIASVILVLILMLTASFAFAEEAAYSEKDYEKACDIIEKANEKITDLVEHAQETDKYDVDKLLDQTGKVIEQATEKVEKLGFEVDCSYDIYVVDGEEIEIDPLYVINPRPTVKP